MTPYQIRYTPTAAESIRHLHPSVKRALREAILGLAAEPFSGHPLAFELIGFRSLRVSRYRVIYRVQEADSVIEVHWVGKRSDIYEVFRRFLERAPKT